MAPTCYIVSRKTLESMSPVKTPTGVVGIARRSLTPLDAAIRAHQPVLSWSSSLMTYRIPATLEAS